ncbi:hypothetical protein C8R46DRAFT_982696 [Mycena filopes]|nr:hypothetical protein C8R46DRAFT_982696 [Mycena filopes]
MSEPPSTKRKRVESDSPDTPASAPTRSKIWMPYGDIILQAESTQFRVSRDILAAQSSVFRDMFGVPQPPNEPTIEGCPIVHVSDTAQDWELLFEVLYDPFQSTVSRPYAVVASMLRLGKKYEMLGPKEDALRRIHAEFPTSLAKYNSDGWSVITDERDLGLHLLNLAYECGVYSAVPALGLICLANHTLASLATAVPRETFVTLAVAFEKSVEFGLQKQMSWLHGLIPHKSCKSRRECLEEQRAINITRTTLSQSGFTPQPWNNEWDQFCNLCEETAKAHYEAGRQKGWELLPSFFGLGTWEDLKDAV